MIGAMGGDDVLGAKATWSFSVKNCPRMYQKFMWLWYLDAGDGRVCGVNDRTRFATETIAPCVVEKRLITKFLY